MKWILMISCFFALSLPVQSFAYQFDTYNTAAQACYAKAMVGMDSVINARLGVPPEAALPLSLKTGTPSGENSTYFTDTLIIILDAYFWEESPHSYALNVFFQCAGGGGPSTLQSVKAELN